MSETGGKLSETYDKDETITAFLRALKSTGSTWQLTDHWDGDLCAVGVSSPTESGRLAYVSSWDQPDGCYYVELELPEGVSEEYAVLRRAEGLPLDEAVLLVVRHLQGASDV